uniref:Peptidase_M16 domain-containing protein n=1 Tax=Caenorhabditis tropicalis TaxID=1561998 RepID=A0A1I7UEU2_9PELO
MRSSLVSKSAVAAKIKTTASPLRAKLSNGLQVVSQDNGGAVSQLILAFRAGSRYQSTTQQGLVHHIRNFVGRDVQSYPGLQLVWASAASGGQMNSFASRDILGVHMAVPRDTAEYALSILGQVASRPAFKPWEIEDVLPTIRADLTRKTPYGIVFEDIHRAAFRNDSLGHSLYAQKNEIGRFGSEEMKEFAKKHFVNGNGVLVGINVDSETLNNYGEQNGAIQDGSLVVSHLSPFRGGDYRRTSPGSAVHVIIAGTGAQNNDVKQLAAQSIIAAHIQTTVSPLTQNILPGGVPSGSAVSASYDGSGLIGIYLNTTAAMSDPLVRRTVEEFRNLKIKNLEGTKRRAINEILFNSQNTVFTGFDLATAALHKGPEPSAIIEEIQKIQEKDVNGFVKTAFERIAISAYGNCSGITYSDEI